MAQERAFAVLASRSSAIAAASILRVGEIRVGSTAVPALGLAEVSPGVVPTISQGRAPSAADEVALGATTMKRLHTHIGGTVEVAQEEHGAPGSVRVVGRTVLPGLAPYPGSDKAGLGVGALLTEQGWTRFSNEYEKSELVFRYRPGKSVADLVADIRRTDPAALPLPVEPVQRPSGVVSLIGLRATPTVLAGLIAALLVAAVSERAGRGRPAPAPRPRHPAAPMGYTSAQVIRTVLWQATTVAAFGLLVGVPVGLVLGRWSWNVLAGEAGMVAVPIVPAATLAVLVVAVVGLANLIGLIPGARAAGSPGTALRAE